MPNVTCRLVNNSQYPTDTFAYFSVKQNNGLMPISVSSSTANNKGKLTITLMVTSGTLVSSSGTNTATSWIKKYALGSATSVVINATYNGQNVPVAAEQSEDGITAVLIAAPDATAIGVIYP